MDGEFNRFGYVIMYSIFFGLPLDYDPKIVFICP